MRAVLLSFFAIFVLSLAGYTFYHFQTVAACSFTSPGYSYGCGYFTNNQYGRADYNVLPGAALINITNADSKDSHGLIYVMNGYLYSSDFQTRLGAAFIIDYMLGHGTFSAGGSANTDESNGIQYARDNFTAWSTLVDYYAHSTNTAEYGINWNYAPSASAFCNGSTSTVTTAYGPIYKDAYSAQHRIAKNQDGVDDMFYNYPCSGKYSVYTDSMDPNYPSGPVTPEIRFYWNKDPNGGSSGLEIARLCGNIQHALSVTPPPNNAPTGQATLSCDPSTGTQTLSNVSITDKDAPTTGYLAVSGSTWTYNVSSGNTYTIQIPTSVAPPFSQVTLSLHAYDSGPLGYNKDTVVWQSGSSVPCASISCGFTVSPTAIDPYMQFSITLTVTSTVSQVPSGSASLQVAPSIPGGSATQSFAGSSSSSSVAVTFSNVGPTAAAGQYSMTGTVSAGGLSASCSGTVPIVYLPYLSVYGGDVMVGSSPSRNPGVCAVNWNGGIYSWNSNQSPSYSGAGTQYAIEALGQIEGFASALGSTNSPPVGLSFANSGLPASQLSPSSGLFGGYFGAPGQDCDFTSDIKSPPISGTTATMQIGSLPFALPLGSQTIIHARGNVYITRDIRYTVSGWATPADIPYFKLVVEGNIYIGSGVHNLDGLYVAENGIIYTCAQNIGVPWDPATTGYYSTCNQKLTINGAFVANQVRFLRTFGSVGQAKPTDTLNGNAAAEVFNYTPELWLPRGASIPGEGYDAITGLPPVL